MTTQTKKWAMIGGDGLVINVAVWDGETDWPHDNQLVDLTDWPHVGIGWKWDGNTFEDVRPPVDYEP